MYNIYGKTDNKKQYAMMIICIIIGVAIGASISGGRVITVADTDRVVYKAQETFTGIDADNLYYAISGNHFIDIGSIYDRCTRRSFETYSLEVNILSYTLSISGGESAIVYILKENLTNPDAFVILDQFQITGNTNGTISLLSGYDIIIVVFYLNVRTIVISGILYHG